MDDITSIILAVGSALFGAFLGGIVTYLTTFRIAKWQFGKTIDFERQQFKETMAFERKQDDDRREQQRILEKEQSDILFKELLREIKDNFTFLKQIKLTLDNNPSSTYDNWLTIQELAEDISFINFESYIGTGLQKYQPEIVREITQHLYRRMLEVTNKIRYTSEHFTAYNGISNADYLRSVIRKDANDLIIKVINETDEVLKKIELPE